MNNGVLASYPRAFRLRHAYPATRAQHAARPAKGSAVRFETERSAGAVPTDQMSRAMSVDAPPSSQADDMSSPKESSTGSSIWDGGSSSQRTGEEVVAMVDVGGGSVARRPCWHTVEGPAPSGELGDNQWSPQRADARGGRQIRASLAVGSIRHARVQGAEGPLAPCPCSGRDESSRRARQRSHALRSVSPA
jgi:hypothetical protein